LLDLGRFFQFLNLVYTVGTTPLKGDQSVARPLPAHRTVQTQNKRTQTSMLRVGFERPIPAFELVKAVHVLDCEATVIGDHITPLVFFLNMESRLKQSGN
jgi:hypothetical protein